MQLLISRWPICAIFKSGSAMLYYTLIHIHQFSQNLCFKFDKTIVLPVKRMERLFTLPDSIPELSDQRVPRCTPHCPPRPARLPGECLGQAVGRIQPASSASYWPPSPSTWRCSSRRSRSQGAGTRRARRPCAWHLSRRYRRSWSIPEDVAAPEFSI